MLQPGGADYVQVHATRAIERKIPNFSAGPGNRANPSLRFMPSLLQGDPKEAAEAKIDPAALASFEALRLNLGTGDTVQSVS